MVACERATALAVYAAAPAFASYQPHTDSTPGRLPVRSSSLRHQSIARQARKAARSSEARSC